MAIISSVRNLRTDGGGSWRKRAARGGDERRGRMVNRRAKTAGISTAVCNHTFRGTGITAYLENGGMLERAQSMANHASTRTTQLYDRRNDRTTLEDVERIRLGSVRGKRPGGPPQI